MLRGETAFGSSAETEQQMYKEFVSSSVSLTLTFKTIAMRVYEIKGHLAVGFGKTWKSAVAVAVTYIRKELELRITLFTVTMFIAIDWNKRYSKSPILAERDECENRVVIR